MEDNSKTIQDILNNIEEQGILEAMGDGISIQDTNFRVLYQNQVHKSFVGEHTGEFCYKAYEKNDQVCDGCPVAKAFQDGNTHTEKRSAPTEKGLAFFEITASPLKDKNGQVVAGIEIARDITENKVAKEELQEREHKYRLLFENLTVGFALHEMIYDDEGNPSDYRFLEINPAFEKLTGVTASALIGKTVKEVLPNTEQYWVDVSGKVALTGEPIAYENYSRELGRYYDTWLFSPSKNKFAVIFSDITERRKTENEQKRLTKELIIKNKELEQMLYVTSHDLRSPLVNINGYSKELDNSLKHLMSLIDNIRIPKDIKEKINSTVNNDIPESLHYIQSSTMKMETLIKGILTLSRFGRSKLTLNKINMNEMITDIVDNNRFRLDELEIKTEVSTLPDCKGDSLPINQLFSNLFDNAIKYSDSGRSSVIKISGNQDNDQSIYCIEDNGVGIAPEHQEQIFEIFHQLEPWRVKGEGMGLTIAYRIIEKHEGKIWVESELGKGSKFFVSLPSYI